MDRGYEVLKVEPARMKVEETLTILTLILCILPTATAHMQTFFLADSHREIENMDIESLYVHACVCVCDVNGLYWGAYISISLYLYISISLYLYISIRLICVFSLSGPLRSLDIALSSISFSIIYSSSIILIKSNLFHKFINS